MEHGFFSEVWYLYRVRDLTIKLLFFIFNPALPHNNRLLLMKAQPNVVQSFPIPSHKSLNKLMQSGIPK